jgi:hypothetical protein
MRPGVAKDAPAVLQLYCRVEVVVDDPAAVAELAARGLRDAGIDWSRLRSGITANCSASGTSGSA